jgi:surfactin synthase thioesterase subunit
MRAGLELDNGDEGLLNGIVKRFRRQTKFYNSYFSGKQDKTNTSVTVIVSKKDPFTYNYTKAEALWKRVVTDVNKVIVIDTPSHYFLKTHTDLLLDEFSKIQF